MSTQTAPIRLRLPNPHAGQRRIISEARRFNAVVCGRRFGKTKLAINRLVKPALQGKPVVYFAPTYKMLAEVWREAANVFGPVTAQKSTQEKRISLITGGSIDMWSLDNPDSARGRKYVQAVIDEAAMIAALEEAWQAVIRPTLTDYRGGAWFMSTPRGLNFFHDLFLRGQDETHDDWASWQLPTSDNPFIPPEEIEKARLELPADIFRQEYLAEFLQGEGAVFRNIPACIKAPLNAQPDQHKGHRLVMGVDWAQKTDFTVLSVFCCDCKCEVALDRFNQIGWEFQRGRVRSLVDRWRVSLIVAEENSIGSPNIEALQREGLYVRPFQTTASSKPPLIQSLALAFERTEAQWLSVPVATGELEQYAATVSQQTGRISYSAPVGKHDDTVIARALAWHAVTVGQFAQGTMSRW